MFALLKFRESWMPSRLCSTGYEVCPWRNLGLFVQWLSPARSLGAMTLPLEDVQSRVPTLSLSLSRVGVTNVEKVIRIRANGSEQLYYAELECFVDLGPDQKGAHMSRFEETVNEVIDEVVLGEATFKAETLATAVAEQVRERQGALRAEVTVAARYPENK